jgi:hypothetical protein
VSWSWAALTSVNNAAWLAYFALSGFWTALVPATSATVLSGLLAIVLARRGGVPKRPMMLASAWAAVLLAAAAVSGRTGLGLGPGRRILAPGHAVGVDGVPVQGHGRRLTGHLAADPR